MTNEVYSRFIFIEFEDLKKVKFDKLEQVCDKVFVFVNKEEKAIPFVLVQQLQKLGESVQWIAVGGETSQNTCHFLSFQLGIIHEQVEEDIEFAIISDDANFDPLIDYLNELGRSTVRVAGNKEKSEHSSDFNGINWSTKKDNVKESEVATPAPLVEKRNGERATESSKQASVSPQSQQLSDRIARETIKRLVMSGNRPAAIDALKSYILLQYNNAEVNRHIDLIIRKLEKTQEIEVKDKEVVYHF